ncbi:hypothetical protein WS62_12065 [Burkholderia sp. ABCPW 14]|nr:hypothetical protein WS62_12065 [Burkholderia sp. ABCPW 14]
MCNRIGEIADGVPAHRFANSSYRRTTALARNAKTGRGRFPFGMIRSMRCALLGDPRKFAHPPIACAFACVPATRFTNYDTPC